MDTGQALLGLGLVVGVIIFGLFGCYVASQKGRSMTEGFIFGALLGPLGLLIVVCLPVQDFSRRQSTSWREAVPPTDKQQDWEIPDWLPNARRKQQRREQEQREL